MNNIEGNWSGKITGTNNAFIFLEITQEGNHIKGMTRINDPIHGVAVYFLDGYIIDNNITATMMPDKKIANTPQVANIKIGHQPVQIGYQTTNHGTVSVNAKLVDAVTIEGTWTSTIGTGGNLFINNSSQNKALETKAIKNKRTHVFVSYSHYDSNYLKRLRIHLKPLEKNGTIDLWDDTRIKAGDKWRDEITKALSNAAIAILIISPDFLASDFIIENELPPLLEKAERDGTKILPVILSPCRFSRDKSLSKYLSLNHPDKPILQMSEFEQESTWNKLSEAIELELT